MSDDGKLNMELYSIMWLGMNKKYILLVPTKDRKEYLIKKYEIPKFIQSQIIVTKKKKIQGQEPVGVFFDEGVYE